MSLINANEELKKNTDNIEISSYEEEIRLGRYRDMKKVYGRLAAIGINVEKI